MFSLFWGITPWQVLQYPHTIFDVLPYRLYPPVEMLALAQKITQIWTRQTPGTLSGHQWLLCQWMWEALLRVSLNKQNSISFDSVAVMTINFHFCSVSIAIWPPEMYWWVMIMFWRLPILVSQGTSTVMIITAKRPTADCLWNGWPLRLCSTVFTQHSQMCK